MIYRSCVKKKQTHKQPTSVTPHGGEKQQDTLDLTSLGPTWTKLKEMLLNYNISSLAKSIWKVKVTQTQKEEEERKSLPI